jgi:hypothetical protein
MHLVDHMLTVDACEAALVRAYEAAAAAHPQDADVVFVSKRLREMSLRRRDQLRGQVLRLSGEASTAPGPGVPWPSAESVGVGGDGAPEWARLLLDLKELYLRASECEIGWTVLLQAARASRDEELTTLASSCVAETERHVLWAKSQLKQAAPQALVVA